MNEEQHVLSVPVSRPSNYKELKHFSSNLVMTSASQQANLLQIMKTRRKASDLGASQVPSVLRYSRLSKSTSLLMLACIMQNNTVKPESPYRIFRFTATKRTRKAIQMKYHSW
jgi:hypothetical protein